MNKNGLLDVAYFSMEIAIKSDMSTYSGGLGVLAGDTLKTIADFKYSAIGITLLHESGYVEQSFDKDGYQIDDPKIWDKEKYLKKLPFTIEVLMSDHKVTCAVWQYDIEGQFCNIVPIYFLDTNLPSNTEYDRNLTSKLYGGDTFYRACQELILGVGGMALLEKLGYGLEKVRIYHLNEGHASFVGLCLFDQTKNKFSSCEKAMDYIGTKLVFTTHTPVASGHDRFLLDDVRKILPGNLFELIPEEAKVENRVCMTRMSLHFSGIVTGVAKTHEKVTEKMFPKYDVLSVTNGAYHMEWTNDNFKKVYDKHIPDWTYDPSSFRKAISIPDDEMWDAHLKCKEELVGYINKMTSSDFSKDVFTLGFARRFTSYKRPDMILADLERLEKMISATGGLQIVFAGKAHPCDQNGKEMIRGILQKIKNYKGKVKMTYLEDYDMDLAKKMISGVDVWLNTPIQKYEASGTSGMKAAFNGVPHLSILDGWWPEGWIEGVTGWAIGTEANTSKLEDRKSWEAEVDDLYNKLGTKIMPLYYNRPNEFTKIMKYTAALTGSYFNTYRMVNEYVAKVYYPLMNGLQKEFQNKDCKKE